MGILNLTEDSFYDGGKNNSLKKALAHTEKMLLEGAFFVDIGVASSKPGSPHILADAEKKRLLPYLTELLREFPTTHFSIDTYNSEVAQMSLDMGVSMINDISGGQLDSKMFAVVAAHNVPYVMMHMQGTPETMQQKTVYKEVVNEIAYFFSAQIKEAQAAGIHDIILDPGFGFGKSREQNFTLLKNLKHFESLNCPLLVGVSRKSMIYKTLGTTPQEALNGTTALHAWVLERGARILRVHDVKEAKECSDLWQTLQ
ncbi:MAG: dihydropteroate synthase [Flavobacteriaceae bacterium]|nr:dihydropteroate synthase [Flavobacteriaceae bacterium]MBL6870581.1 dihydropteroate synthase [Flavobacteriaceae bacterium]